MDDEGKFYLYPIEDDDLLEKLRDDDGLVVPGCFLTIPAQDSDEA